jgi:ketosteroid isomerase-like protein
VSTSTRLYRAALIDLVENRYFGNVTREDVDAVAACFTDDAEIVIRHGDAPTRVMKASPAPGETDMRDFWRHVDVAPVADTSAAATPAATQADTRTAGLDARTPR